MGHIRVALFFLNLSHSFSKITIISL